MLVVSRKPGESIVIADSIIVTVVAVQGNRVRVGVEAPGHVRIQREEIAGPHFKPGADEFEVEVQEC